MKLILLGTLCLSSSAFASSSMVRSPSVDETVADFFTLDLEDEAAVIRIAQLSKTRQLMSLAESLIKSVHGNKSERAEKFTSDALQKKHEKQEQRATLSTHLSRYQTQIEQTIEAISTLEADIKRYEDQLDEGEKSIERLTQEVAREKAHIVNLELHSDVPHDAERSAGERLDEFMTEKGIAESALIESTTMKGELQAHLAYNKAIMRSMVEEQELTQRELAQVTEIIRKLDAALVRIGKKYQTISPTVLAGAATEFNQLARNTDLETFSQQTFIGIYSSKKTETLWELFCRLIGYKRTF